MVKAIRTWILIADGARARVLVHDGPGRGVKQIPGFDFREEHPADRDIYADRPGRAFESANAARHAYERSVSAHREAKMRFAQRIAAFLDDRLLAKGFERLVIAAPPATLADLRSALTDRLKTVVAAELAKDLTKIPNDDLAPYLATVLAV